MQIEVKRLMKEELKPFDKLYVKVKLVGAEVKFSLNKTKLNR